MRFKNVEDLEWTEKEKESESGKRDRERRVRVSYLSDRLRSVLASGIGRVRSRDLSAKIQWCPFGYL